MKMQIALRLYKAEHISKGQQMRHFQTTSRLAACTSPEQHTAGGSWLRPLDFRQLHKPPTSIVAKRALQAEVRYFN